ncbi:chitin synthase (macronuclear) [Tetrahymena thermophila SB210]|uniref:chitin synthase n=1 Tax=Tetrahymena thermophila (strain SB210) TaxID=312017 RepID=Q22Z65_TETTS|nr:chitin synthase [Tetrahymena thermophila SB210]EAR90456.3 chitin synthase [Tetrahymena thermophila SB210]|eukprot:XP_001010701.3 chitin synthase [Tetrahymena thermophila SB210]
MISEQSLNQRLIINENEFNASCLDQTSNNSDSKQQTDPQMYQKPLDLFMVCTGQDDQDGKLQPLNIFTQKIQPKTEYLQEESPYIVNFDESSYLNPSQLRPIAETDGLIGYYSKNKYKNVIQMLICVTMYSEDRHFLEQTLLHIQKNLQGFSELGVQNFQIVVAVIYDGIMKIKEEVVEFYCELEKGESIDLDRNLKTRRELIQNQIDFLELQKQSYLLDANEGLPPSIPKNISLFYQNKIQIKQFDKQNRNSKIKILCPYNAEFNQNEPNLTVFSIFKHKNAKKLSSHLWFFEGLCRQVRPKYVSFVDVGTLPSELGLVQFYKVMEGNYHIGGVCGFLGLEEPPEGGQEDNTNQKKNINQKHLNNKNFDSFLGFLHVLPGAWSAYRYDALEVQSNQKTNFMQENYFQSVLNPDLLTNDIKEANKFLAEDRILCLGIISAKGQNYQLKYIPDAYAVTDSPQTLEEFIQQRRRWTNSMIFALNHVLKNYKQSIKESIHSKWFSKVRLPLNMYFAFLGLINYILLPAFFLFMAVLSGYQFYIPSKQPGKSYVDSSSQQQSCILDYDLTSSETMCDTNIKQDCYQECQTGELTIYQKIFNIFMKILPLSIVMTVLLFMIVCLTFKMKKQNFSEYLQLFNSVINEEDKKQIEEFRQILRAQNKSSQQIETKVNNLIQKLGEKRLNDFKILFESKKSHKLPQDLRKIKSEYDRLYTQKYYNKVYKIFASLFSIQTLLLVFVITFSLYINIFAPQIYKDIGFYPLPKWMRLYIIIIIIINTGFFFMIMGFHLLFQPRLVWLAFKSYLSFTFYAPVYQIFLSIYSFCNLDDVTWGTKGLQSSTQNQIFVSDKVRYVRYWVWINSSFILAFLSASLIPLDKTPYVVIGLGIYCTLYNVLRISGGTINYLKYYLFDKLKIKKQLNKIVTSNLQNQEELKRDYLKSLSLTTVKQINTQETSQQQFFEDKEQLVFSRSISKNYSQNNSQQEFFRTDEKEIFRY